MKKQFFYAAMAVALMASCTSEDNLAVDPIDPTPDAEDKVALNLGVATPAMTVGSRGTGMVGFVGTADDNATNASWDSQRLFVTMVDQTTNEVYEEPDGTEYFAGVEFRAPKSAPDNNEGLIRMYKTYNVQPADNGILEYKYYPVTGEYTFYGWHIDDATAGGETDGTGITTTFGKESDVKVAKVSGIVIDGTQDLLAANTEVIPETEPTEPTAPYYHAVQAFTGDYDEMVDKQFSARTARNGFTPILNFEHTLARLQFFVKSGKGSDAALNYVDPETAQEVARDNYPVDASNWAETDATADDYDDWEELEEKGMLNGAIYVTGVKLLGVYDNVELDLVNQTANIKEGSAIAANGFTLMSTPAQVNAANAGVQDWTDLTTKELQTLVPVAPTYATNHPDYNGNEADQIGESIMYLPVAGDVDPETTLSTGTDQIIKLQVQLGQCLIKTEDESKDESDPTKYTYYWDNPKPVTLTLKASSLTVPDGSGLSQEFAAGRSYNVYIIIYGRERIEVSANLVPWVEGGDIETDIEDGEQ